MPNANDNKASDKAAATPNSAPQNTAVAEVKTAAESGVKDVKEAAGDQINNLGKQAGDQMQNVAQGATDQVKNLGQAGVNEVQNLGQAGVNKMSQMVGQITNPNQDLRQPPMTKEEKVYATIAYIPFVAIISIIIKPDSAYVRLHSKQGLMLSILFFLGGIFAAIVSLFGIVGQFLAFFLGLIPMASLVIAVYSMYLAASGFWWKIPVLSSVADLIPVEMMAKTSKENITGQMGTAKVDFDNRQDTLQKENVQNQPPATTVVATPTEAPVQQTPSSTNPTTNSTPSTPAGTGPVEGPQSK